MFLEETLDEVSSTNDYLRRYCDEPTPRMVRARRQTAGRGRYAREWYSPRDQGLYLSFLFFPEWSVEKAAYLNMLGSLTVVDSLAPLLPEGKSPRIKPPNDVFIGERKIAGVLAELATLGQRIQWVILGMGVNVEQREFPEEIQDLATSLVREARHSPSLDQLAGIHRDHFTRLLKDLRGGHWNLLKERYQEKQ